MIIARFPQTVYMTRRRFNDYMSDDMRYGDMTEYQLKNKFGSFCNATIVLVFAHSLLNWMQQLILREVSDANMDCYFCTGRGECCWRLCLLEQPERSGDRGAPQSLYS